MNYLDVKELNKHVLTGLCLNYANCWIHELLDPAVICYDHEVAQPWFLYSCILLCQTIGGSSRKILGKSPQVPLIFIKE